MEFKNPLKGKSTAVKILVVIGIALLCIAGVTLAVTYVLQTSTPVDVTVTGGTVQIPVTLSASATNMPDTDPLTLTATVTDAHGIGFVVNFYDGTTVVGTATIANVGGIYKASVTLPALSLTEGVHHFTAGP